MTSKVLRDDLAALAWSLWAELGVSGWARHHQSWFVDPEPLIVFTAWLGDTDARLRDETTDWCVSFGSWVSATRLANLLETASEDTRRTFGELAATVANHSTVRWRGATETRTFTPTKRSRLESFEPPAAVSLRLRSLFGVGARAEIIRLLIASPDAQSASEIAEDAAFKKRNVADALDALRRGGALDDLRSKNQIKYRIREPKAWSKVLGALPKVWPRWTRILPLLATTADGVERTRRLSRRAASVETDKLEREIRSRLDATQLMMLAGGDTAEGRLDRLEAWASRIVVGLAEGDTGVLERRAR